MRAECSRKITFLNYVLSGLIVLLHSCDIIRTTEFSAVVENGEIILICKMLERLGKVAVPTFFALSGYLFFRDCNYQNIRRKITSRMKSLVIPFCFWNIFFYCVYIALNNVPGIGSRINFEIPRFWVKAFIINNVVNPPMWFLSRLIVLHISALIGLFLFKKIRSYNLSWIIALMTVDLIIGFGYQSPLHWGGVYYLGGYMAYFYSDVVENKGVFGRIPTVIRGILLGGLAIATLFLWEWIFAPLLVWLVMDMLKDFSVKPIMKASFFIMCTHYFGVRVVRKVLTILLGISPQVMLLNLLLTAAVVFLLASIVDMLFRKWMPNLHTLVCGGR